MRSRSGCRIALVLVFATSLAQGASRNTEIPFRLVNGFGIVVHGEIGPMNNLNFLFDTGAVPSAISRRIASRIGIKGNSGALAYLHTEIQAQYVTLGDLRFGTTRVASLPVVVVDLDPLEKILGLRIDALIGLDVLTRQSFGIDYKRGKIELGLEGKPLHVTGAKIYPFADTSYWAVTVNLGGREFRVLLDTGADGLALFSRDIPKSFLDRSRKTAVVSNLAGQTTIQTLEPQVVTIGSIAFEKQTVAVLPDPPTAFQNLDGVMGPRSLGITHIEFDWQGKCLRWDKE